MAEEGRKDGKNTHNLEGDLQTPWRKNRVNVRD